MSNILFSLAAFIVALGVLITVHEFGHYWVARKAGVKVLRFSIGFGKPLWKRIAGPDATEYIIAAIPLGGYVKMLDEREGEVDSSELDRAFNRQSLSKRFAIVFAGPLFNFIFAIIAYWIMFMGGIPGIKPIIGEVKPDSIAYFAEFVKGDEIVAVDKKDTPTWNATRIAMLSAALENKKINLSVVRIDGTTRELSLDLSTITANLKEGKILDELGIIPYRPIIPAIIGQIQDGGQAQKAGMKTGDEVLSADGEQITGWIHWVEYIRERPEQNIEVKINRDNKKVTLELIPKRIEEGDKVFGRIGAGVQEKIDIPDELKAELQYSPGTALINACVKTWDMSILTLRMLGKMVTGELSVDNLSGPITIAKYAGYTASAGLVTFMAFLAIVSISLGVLNLLPIPMLDGGHLMMYFVELIKGSPLSEEIQLMLQKVGLVLLLMLMSVAFYNDIARLLS